MLSSREKEFFKLSSILENIINIIDNMSKSINKSDDNSSYQVLSKIKYEIESNLESLQELLNPFLLFVVGSGNYGKSTVINALLEDTFIKTKDLPNTWKLDLFYKSDNEKIEIIYNDKKTELVSIDEGFELLNKEEERFRKSRRKVFKLLNEYKLNNNVNVKELKKYKKNLEKKYLYISNIVEVRYYLKKDGILDDFTIVDTPGLNQVLSKRMINSIDNYYLKSDGIIWIIDAQNIISKKSSDLILDIDKINKSYNIKKNMILVVNKMDIVNKNNSINSYKIKIKVKELYRNMFDDIVFLSAKNAVDGISKDDNELIDKSNIRILRSSINKYFKKTSELNQVKSKYKNLNIMSEKIMKIIEVYKRDLYKDISIYNKSRFDLNEKINEHKKYVINLLIDIKNKSYYKEIYISEIEKRLKEIEIICNNELNKLYEQTYKEANLKKYSISIPNSFNIYFTKNKNIVIDYKLLKALNRTDKEVSSKDKILKSIKSKKYQNIYHDNLIIKNKIYKNLNTLIDECVDSVNNSFNLISRDLKVIREYSFEEKYLKYEDINIHIKELESIYNILKNLR